MANGRRHVAFELMAWITKSRSRPSPIRHSAGGAIQASGNTRVPLSPVRSHSSTGLWNSVVRWPGSPSYFVRTLLPMHASRILVVGTTLHAADLLQRLRPSDRRVGRIHDFEWRRFRAINETTNRALWPQRHPYEELIRIRDLEPVMFSAENQNDPTDEIATFFPRALTQPAVDAGANLTLQPFYKKRPGEWVVLGADLARSERIGADYTVVVVVVYDQNTRQRRVIATRRVKGLDFQGQITMFLTSRPAMASTSASSRPMASSNGWSMSCAGNPGATSSTDIPPVGTGCRSIMPASPC